MIPERYFILKTKHFTLRPLRLKDAPDIVRHINDPEIFRNLLTTHYPYTLGSIRGEIKQSRNRARRKNRTDISFAIEINGECAGIASIHDINGHKAEISYWIGRQYRGKGIMTRVVKELTKFGFGQLNLCRMYAHILPFNKASMRVVEKAGYKMECVLRKNLLKNGKVLDEHQYARVK